MSNNPVRYGFCRLANYKIVLSFDDIVILRDLGPWDQHLTITNDAEGVLQRLKESGDLRRFVLYVDSEGEVTGIKHEDGVFKEFTIYG